MNTGSLQRRLALTTLSLLALVLAAVIAVVTLAYRSKLDGELRSRLTAAGTAVTRAGSGDAAKPLVEGLALERAPNGVAHRRLVFHQGDADRSTAHGMKYLHSG